MLGMRPMGPMARRRHYGGGGGGGSLPSDVAGLWLWYEGTASYSGGTWSDLSGNARDAAQPTSGLRAATGTDADGKPCLVFDGSDDRLILPDLSGLTSADIFIRRESTAARGVGLWDISGDTFSTHVPYTDGTVYDGAASTSRKTVGTWPGSDGVPETYNVSSSSGAWSARFDGTLLYSTATNAVGWPPAGDAMLGGDANPGFNFHGKIAAFLIYSSVLSAPDRAIVESYLSS